MKKLVIFLVFLLLTLPCQAKETLEHEGNLIACEEIADGGWLFVLIFDDGSKTYFNHIGSGYPRTVKTGKVKIYRGGTVGNRRGIRIKYLTEEEIVEESYTKKQKLEKFRKQRNIKVTESALDYTYEYKEK